jgi:hypothetical protein
MFHSDLSPLAALPTLFDREFAGEIKFADFCSLRSAIPPVPTSLSAMLRQSESSRLRFFVRSSFERILGDFPRLDSDRLVGQDFLAHFCRRVTLLFLFNSLLETLLNVDAASDPVTRRVRK